jgi:hypothetical protein
MMPPLNLNLSAPSTATAGSDGYQAGSSIGSPFYVNFGNGVTQGGGMPAWVWLAGAVAVGLWLLKRR